MFISATFNGQDPTQLHLCKGMLFMEARTHNQQLGNQAAHSNRIVPVRAANAHGLIIVDRVNTLVNKL